MVKYKKITFLHYKLYLILFFLISFTACQTGSKFEPHSAEEAIEEGIRLFDKKEYTDAMSFFDMVKLQYPGSRVADKAQYYIAEINFARKEYILASFNYNRVRTVYPGSLYARIALYKAGYSQYLLAPDYHKDQEFTKKAIRTLQDFQYYYPEKDSLYNETDIMIVKLRNTLGQKDYETAQLYKKLESPRSALIYYDSVIKDYDDTDFFEPAWFGKIEMLYMLKRTEEAENAVLMYNKLFPDGKFTSDIKAVATGKYINK